MWANNRRTLWQWVVFIIILIAFILFLIYNHMNEMIPVRLTTADDESCMVVTGEPSDYTLVKASGRACEGLDSIFYMEEDAENSHVTYQVGQGQRFCLTDEQLLGRTRLTLKPCMENAPEQQFTEDDLAGRLISDNAVVEGLPKQCISSSITTIGAATGEDFYHLEVCTVNPRPETDLKVSALAKQAVQDTSEERLAEMETA
jgi:hypothetical protein